MILETIFALSCSHVIPLLLAKMLDNASDKAAEKEFRRIRKRDDTEFKEAILDKYGRSLRE